MPATVIRALSGDTTAVAVYATLATYADGEGRCRPFQSTLADDLGIDVGTVRRAITRIATAGLVVKSPRFDAHRHKIGNEYLLTPSGATARRAGSRGRSRAPIPRDDARSTRAGDPLSRKEQLPMNKETPLPIDEPRLASVSPITPGRLLDVPSVVDVVFDAWRRSTGKSVGRTKLTPKRRKCIEARVKDGYSVEDLTAAVQGWRRSPFHCGANESRTVYNELTLLLRDGEHVEKFAELHEQSAPSVVSMSTDPAVAAINRQREREGR